jgi:hypothetical protein
MASRAEAKQSEPGLTRSRSSGRAYSPPVDSMTPFCVSCGYNLTALTSARCPECGWEIDWQLAWKDEESRREGSPAYLARGWSRCWATVATVALMLLRPVRFAKRLRYDESLIPAFLVAIGSCVLAALPYLGCYSFRESIHWACGYLGGIVACVLVNLLAFISLGPGGRPRKLSGRQRARLFLLVSLYGTCFVAAWSFLGMPPVVKSLSPSASTFLWPLGCGGSLSNHIQDWRFLGRTAIFYWWTTVLVIFASVRIHPRWAAVLFLPVPFISDGIAFFAGAKIFFLTGGSIPFPYVR